MIHDVLHKLRGLPALALLIATVLYGRWALVVLQRQHPASTIMLLVIACAATARVLRDVRELRGDRTDRALVTRNATVVVAALLGCIATATHAKWANGSVIVATVFVFILEFMRVRADPPQSADAIPASANSSDV